MKHFLDKPASNRKHSLKQQIGMALNRWDNQDFRVDLNWTDFEYHVLRNKVYFKKDHVRHLVFENTGALPVTSKR